MANEAHQPEPLERIASALERIADSVEPIPGRLKTRPSMDEMWQRFGFPSAQEQREQLRARQALRWVKVSVIVAALSMLGTITLAVVAITTNVL